MMKTLSHPPAHQSHFYIMLYIIDERLGSYLKLPFHANRQVLSSVEELRSKCSISDNVYVTCPPCSVSLAIPNHLTAYSGTVCEKYSMWWEVLYLLLETRVSTLRSTRKHQTHVMWRKGYIRNATSHQFFSIY